jgi:D-alanine-D-alanine ligase
MLRIVVLRGGRSSEREVSLVSGREIALALKQKGYEVSELDPADYPDTQELFAALKDFGAEVVFIGLHGGSGEDGQIQAALKAAGFLFTGSGFHACSMTMDKYVSKLMAISEGITTPDFILMREDLIADYGDPEDYTGFIQKLGLPMIVKPNDNGSSVGISKVEKLSDLKQAVRQAFEHSSAILLEKFIPGREITCTVLDGKALPLVEIRPYQGWYDYQNKYNSGRSDYLAPAPLDASVTQLIQLYSERLWKVFGLNGYARIDFRYDEEKPYFLEVNTLPGMTPLSLTPMAAKTMGMSFSDLVETIVDQAINPNKRSFN